MTKIRKWTLAALLLAVGSAVAQQSSFPERTTVVQPTAADLNVTVTDGAGALNVIVDSGALTVSATDLDIRNLTAANDTVVANAGTGTFTVGDGAGALNVIVDSGTISLNQTGSANDVDVLTMPTVTVTATNLDVQIGGSDTVTVAATDLDVRNLVAATDIVTANTTDPCGAEKATPFNVNLSSATTVLVATGVGGENVYICGYHVVTGAAQGLAFIAGTGATCGTSTAGMTGGTTGATGMNFGANGGIALAHAGYTHTSTQVSGGATGDSVCIVTSTTAQTSGTIMYVIAP